MASKQVGSYTVARFVVRIRTLITIIGTLVRNTGSQAGGIPAFSQTGPVYPEVVNSRAQPAHPLMKRIAMTAPRTPQWPLTPALRLAALALLFVGGAIMTTGWLSFILWFAAVVLLVFAAIQLARNWSRRR